MALRFFSTPKKAWNTKQILNLASWLQQLHLSRKLPKMLFTDLTEENYRKVCQLLISVRSAENHQNNLNISHVLNLASTCKTLFDSIKHLKLKLSLNILLPFAENSNIVQSLHFVSKNTAWIFSRISIEFNNLAECEDSYLAPLKKYQTFLRKNVKYLDLRFRSEKHYDTNFNTIIEITTLLTNDDSEVSVWIKSPDYYDDSKRQLDFEGNLNYQTKIKSVCVTSTITLDQKVINDLGKFCPFITRISLMTNMTSPKTSHSADVLLLSMFKNLKVIQIEGFLDTDSHVLNKDDIEPLFANVNRLEVLYINEKNVFFGQFINAHMPKLEYLSILHNTDNMKTYGPPLFQLSPLPESVKTVRIHYLLMPQLGNCENLEELCLFVRFYNPQRFKDLFTKIQSNNLRLVNVIFESKHSRKELIDLAITILQQFPALKVLSLRSANIDCNDTDTAHKKLLRQNSRMIQTSECLRLLMVEKRPVSVSRKLEGYLINRMDELDEKFGWDIRKAHNIWTQFRWGVNFFQSLSVPSEEWSRCRIPQTLELFFSPYWI